MPKMKTNKSITKRFRRTASGKFKRPHSNRRHLLTGRKPKRMRHLKRNDTVDAGSQKMLERLLPYA